MAEEFKVGETVQVVMVVEDEQGSEGGPTQEVLVVQGIVLEGGDKAQLPNGDVVELVVGMAFRSIEEAMARVEELEGGVES